jgi:hypothetical protein
LHTLLVREIGRSFSGDTFVLTNSATRPCRDPEGRRSRLVEHRPDQQQRSMPSSGDVASFT